MMTPWTQALNSDEVEELKEAYRENFRRGDIDEGTFRRNMARLGLNATDIDAEVEENQS